MDLVFFRGNLAVERPLGAEIEVDAWIDLLQLGVVVDLIFDAVPRGVKRPQAARGVARRPAVNIAHQVRHKVHVLVHRHAGKFHAERLVTCASHGGVERVVDVRRHVLRVRADARARIVLGHRTFDESGELAQGLIAGQRTRKAVGRALPRGAVAGSALLAVDFLAAAGFGGLLRYVGRQGRGDGQAYGSR